MANSWVFIDSRVSDKELLISQLASGTSYLVLDEYLDGIGQIVSALSGLGGFDSIQIISHGSPGSITIGSTELNSSSISSYSSDLALIGNALTETGDLLLYGCNVGAGEEGELFVETLAAMTGADVAASDDLTGGIAADGDWALEGQSGTIESSGLKYQVNPDSYGSVLATLTNAGFESDMTGWIGSSASVITGGSFGNGWTVTPYGSKMVYLAPGSVDRSTTFSTLMVGTDGQNYLNGQFSNPTNFAYLYQDVALSAGAVISMAWNYIATDYAPYNDASWVSFVNTSNTSDASMQINVGAYGYTVSQVAILGATVSGTGNYVTGDYGSTGWQYLSLKAGAAGTYRIGFAAFNLADQVFSPYLIVDQDRGLTYHNGVLFEPIGPPTNPPEPPGLVGPTLTAFSGALGTVAEDTEIALSLNDLLLKGNEADSDGTVTGFIVDVVSSGTLKIGSDAVSATPFNASTNNKIDATHNAYWTPSQNANGTLNAFTVYALDNDGLLSATAVQTTISVSPVNDEPVIGGASITVFIEQTPVQLGDDIGISDPDGEAGWNGGVLRVQITANAEVDDVLSLPATNPGASAIWLDSAGNLLMAGSTEIGTADAVSVSSGEQWSFTFNANATSSLVQALARSLVFSNDSDYPGSSARTITLTVTDNLGESGHLDQTLTITQVNDAPVFSGFSDVVGTTNEDTQIEITLDALKAQGDESDVDGTVLAFVVRSLTTGSLKIGSDAGSAIAWDAVTNNTIDATHNGYWKGGVNENGALSAFTVVAKDNDGAESATPIQAIINVNPVNDQPELTEFSVPLDTTLEDTEVAVSFNTLIAQGDEADVDGTIEAFVVNSISGGSLKIGSDVASATPWNAVTNNAIDASHQAFWTPAENANGSLNAFTVVARDDSGDESVTPVQVSVDVTPVNDAPTIGAGCDGHSIEGAWFNHVVTLGDPDDDTHLVTVNWGDGTPDTEFGSGLHLIDLSHLYTDNGTCTVTVTADDQQGAPNSVEMRSFQVVVSNVAPTASVTGNDRVNEGAVYTLHVGAVADPGADTRTGYSINWGDGSSDTFTTLEWATAAGTFNHTYNTSGASDAARSIAVYTTDEDGTFALGSKSVTVNVPPGDIYLSNATIDENSPEGTVVGILTTPESSAHTYTLLDDANGRFNLSGNQISVAAGALLDFDSDPVHMIRVRATDDEGLFIDKNLFVSLRDMGPDLSVSGVGSSQVITDIDYGSSMEIFWTISTTGTELSNASWVDRVYFDDPMSPGFDHWIGDYPVSISLPLGEYLTRIQTVAIPSNMYGDFRIVVLTDYYNTVDEGAGAEGNNTASDDTVYTILNSNLQVESVTAPLSAFTGREIEVEWIVGNAGNAGTGNRYWYDTLYFSADTVLDSSDTWLRSVRNESYLDEAGQYSNTISVTLPANIEGEYYVLVKTDGENYIPEGGFESDNVTASAAIDVDPIPASELSDPAIVSVAAPAMAFSGQNMSLTYTIDNAGEAVIEGSSRYWVEHIYMSSNDVLDGSDFLLKTIWRDLSESQLPEPEHATHFTTTEKVTLPVGVWGDNWFFVTLSPISPVTNVFTVNDMAYDAIPVDVRLTPPPDLWVSGMSASAMALAGHDLTVSYRVLNTGATTTPNSGWYDEIWLSSDTLLDGGDTRLSEVWHSGQLAPAGPATSMTFEDAVEAWNNGMATGYYIDTLTLRLPDGLTGTYYLIASTDSRNQVFELDNLDNTGEALAVDIESLPADLVVSDVMGPQVAQAGQSMRITWSVLNNGIGATSVTEWNDRIVLSNDSVPGNSDDIILGTVSHNGTLGVDESYSNSTLVSLPGEISGSYQLFVTTDIHNQVYEAGHDGNNTRPLGVGLDWEPGDDIPDGGVAAKPQLTADLQVHSVSVPERVNSGEPLSIDYSVSNEGAGSTNVTYWWDRVILSEDTIVGNSDDVDLGTRHHVNGLASGLSYSATAFFTIPIDLSGEYHVFVRTDANGHVTETGAEDNNVAEASGTVIIDLGAVPDMILSSLQAADEGVSGQDFTIGWTVQNNGAAMSGEWRQVFYLSRDGILDRYSDIYLGYTNTSGILAAGEVITSSQSFRIPNGISGKYYVFGIVDSHSQFYERDGEDNNITLDSSPLQIAAPDPVDLVAGVISVPDNGVAGGETSIEYTVSNVSEKTLSGRWRDNIYLSTDTVWDVNDALFDRVEIIDLLGAGQSYTKTATGTLPGLVGGDYYVIIRSDILNQVIESNENNNLSASLDATHLDVEVLGLGIPDSDTITAGGSVYYRVNAEAGDTIRVAFDRDASSGRTELYVSYGEMPSRSDFDYRYSRSDSSDQSIVISNAKGGSYYVMAYNTIGTSDSYSISADRLVFSITDLGADSGSNKGRVTVRIEGAELTGHTTAMLVDSEGGELVADQIYWKDNTELWATFDLRGLETGAYDLRIEDNGRTAEMVDGFTVNSGAVGHVEYSIQAPSALRPGQTGTVRVFYQNTGETDVSAPLLNISGNALLKNSGDDEFGDTSYQLLGTNSEGPAGTLAPGASGSFQLFFRPDFSGGGTVNLTVSTINPDEVIDWETILDAGKPESVRQAAWETVKTNLIAEFGTTAGDYQDSLARIASYLDQMEGRFDALEILCLLNFQKATVRGMLLLPTTPGVLGYSHIFLWDITATTQADGSVLIDTAASKLLFTLDDQGGYALSGQGTATLAQEGGVFVLRQMDGTVITFNADGRFSEICDANGHTTDATYADGLLISVGTDTGHQLHFTYNEAGRLVEVVDEGDRTITYAYDDDNLHLLSVTTIDVTTQYGYVSEGAAEHRINMITLPDGTVRHFEYDDQGRLVSEYLGDHAEELTYSYIGVNEIIVTDANGAETHLSLNEFGQIAQTEDALGNVTQLQYDEHGNLTEVINPDETSSSGSYNADGNLVLVRDALGNTVDFSYDEAFGHLAQATDQRDNAIVYGYDPHGNLASVTYVDGSTETYTYDANGYMNVSVSRGGQIIGYTYNAQGRLVLKSFEDGTTANYTYNDHGNLTSAVDDDSSTTFEYDEADHLIMVTDAEERWVGYDYDEAGRLIEMSDHSGKVTHYSYNPLGHLSGLTDAAGALIAAYQYDSVGWLSRGENGNGTYTTYEYDAAGQLLHLVNCQADGTVNSRFDYTYDEMGRRTSETTTDGITTYGYDALGQLTDVVLPGGRHIIYHYDETGNRTAVDDGEFEQNYVVNDLNEYVSAGTVTYDYDDNGNLVSEIKDGVETTYGYDDEHHLISVTTSDDSWSYEYDALGNRIATVHNGNRTEYLLDLTGTVSVAVEYDASGNPAASYVYGLGLESAMIGGTAAWYDFNAIGSTAGLTGLMGNYLNEYKWLPYGETLSVMENVDNPFEYLGQWGVMNEDNGLDFMHSRYYSADEGRYIQTNPAGIDDGLNLYTYAENDPVNLPGTTLDIEGCAVVVTHPVFPDPQLQPETVQLFIPEQLPSELLESPIDDYLNREIISEYLFCLNDTWWFFEHDCEVGFVDDPVIDIDIRVIQPKDPNDIVGPQGFGDDNWTGIRNALGYTIHYENQESATAPAQEVIITQMLDSDLDPVSFRLGDFGWGDLYIDVPDDAVIYIDRLDLRETKGYMVDVVAGIDIENGEAFWSFTTIDPETGEIPEDPTIGFLPPNNEEGVGDGFVNYTIRPDDDVLTGTVIDAEATIIFTTQEPIDTPAIANTLDVDLPESQVKPIAGYADLTVDSAQFLVSWSGSDIGSAIANVTVYVSDNGGEYTAWLEESEMSEANFAGEQGHSYSFYTRASDNAGNMEAAPEDADLVVHVTNEALLYDTATPEIIGVILPAAGQYIAGDSLDFTVSFSETVVVDVTGVPPVIRLTVGSSEVEAVCHSGNGTDALTFRYVVADGVYDNDGIEAGGEIVTNGALIRDIAGIPVADLTFEAGATDAIRIDLAPTLTGFSAPVDQTYRNTQVTITLAELLEKGNESDVDGTVDAFVIKSVTSGTLLVGADAVSATAFDALTNNRVDSTHRAYWMPGADAHGELDAFTVVAIDNVGVESATPSQVTVEVLNAMAGSTGNDSQAGSSGDDILYGDAGNDSLVGNDGNDLLDGGTGADRMEGGWGNDYYVVDSTGDVVKESAGRGTDSVAASVSFTLPVNVENLTLTGSDAINGKGNVLSNVMTGNDGANVLNGGTGADTIYGGDGNDTIYGGPGIDMMTGGEGSDTFVFDYLLMSESGIISASQDSITDFVSGEDMLDLSAVDANVLVSGNQAFNNTILSGEGAFTAAGQLRFDSATGILYGNTDSNVLTAEITIELTGVLSLTADDFVF